jgi:hypothetical protein
MVGTVLCSLLAPRSYRLGDTFGSRGEGTLPDETVLVDGELEGTS